MLKQLSAAKWNYTTAAHLLNRAGFGGPPWEIDTYVKFGLEKAVSWLVDFERIADPAPDPTWAHPDPDRVKKRLAIRNATPEQRQELVKQQRQEQNQQIVELRGWWLNRMANTPRPLQEKMTLFWHGHFATSFEKVRDAYYMWRQNELFRRLCTGNWLQLLTETAKDPAMLIWLDQAQSRKDHPNENFAREVMELFALGEGHYTEHDITEAARALTGWSLDQEEQKFVERPNIHDYGFKTFLGRTGNLDGNDVLSQIVAVPQAGLFITAKIWNFFTGQPPSPSLNQELAHVFSWNGNNFKPLLKTMFLSEDFYESAIIRNQVKSPVQWLISSVRMLECELPPPFVSANLIRSLGQDLFAPPNVKGWDGGITWITTNNLLGRYNEAATIVKGDASMAANFADAKKPQQAQRIQNRMRRTKLGGVDVEKILTADQRGDKDALVTALETRLLQAKLKKKQESTLREFLSSKTELSDADIRDAIRLVMSTPEFQVT